MAQLVFVGTGPMDITASDFHLGPRQEHHLQRQGLLRLSKSWSLWHVGPGTAGTEHIEQRLPSQTPSFDAAASGDVAGDRWLVCHH